MNRSAIGTTTGLAPTALAFGQITRRAARDMNNGGNKNQNGDNYDSCEHSGTIASLQQNR
ncbi:hypothetical protein B0T36_03915 [Nocardia donostiensis]|uniref:hypothetical protein n=1 Tax=Nocardia donostiensis TaxID=1538463 RepID=UPI0009D9DD07|nr:hypothetical protein [Nocardia donostiensis]OQS16805.1 hypothetical protein B0T36_03915 [Nocardia donostiensis]